MASLADIMSRQLAEKLAREEEEAFLTDAVEEPVEDESEAASLRLAMQLQAQFDGGVDGT
jgi:hypothetical protein